MRRRPGEDLGLSCEGIVERGHGSSNLRQESMVVVNHADEFLQAFTVVGVRKVRTVATFSCSGRTPL